jgi:hypothetical protein
VATRAEEFKAKAAECLRLSQEFDDPAAKAMLLVMAQRWLELAEQVGRASAETSDW